MVEAEMSYHSVYPSWDGPLVVIYLFLYLFISAPTTAFTWLSTFCTLHLSSTPLPGQQGSNMYEYIIQKEVSLPDLAKILRLADHFYPRPAELYTQILDSSCLTQFEFIKKSAKKLMRMNNESSTYSISSIFSTHILFVMPKIRL